MKSTLTEEKPAIILAAEARQPTKPNKSAWSLRWAWLWLLLLAGILLILAHQFPASYIFTPGLKDSDAYLSDFHDREVDKQGDEWRWSKPQSYVRLLPLDVSMRVTLTVETSKPPEDATRLLQLGLVNDPKPQSYQVPFGRSTQVYDTNRVRSFLPQIFSIYRDGFLDRVWFNPTLQIQTDVFQPPQDRRQLGMIIRLVAVASAPAFGSFGFPTLLEFILTLVLVLVPYFLMRSLFGLHWGVVLVSTIPLLVWLALVAWGRVFLATNLDLISFGIALTAIGLTAARLLAPAIWHDLSPLRLVGGMRVATPVPDITATGTEFPPTTRYNPKGLNVIGWVIVGGLLIPFMLFLLGSLNPFSTDPYFNRGWGFNYLAQSSIWLLAIVIIIAVLACFPPLNRQLAKWLENMRLSQLALGWWLLITALIAIIVFSVWRTQNSYGDSQELMGRLTSYFSYREQFGNVPFMVWREREPLDFALHFLLWLVMLNFEWWKPELTYIVPSILAGAVFVVVLVLLVRQLTNYHLGRWLIATMTLSSGTLLVFCGYTESYTFVTLAATIYILLAVYAIKGNASPLWAALALAIAILLHPLALFLSPSFGFVLAWRAGLGDKVFRWRQLIWEGLASLASMAAVLATLMLLFAFYGYNWRRWGISQGQLGGSDEGMFKPLFSVRAGSREIFPVFSLDYVVFEFNLWVRVMPLALFVITILMGWHLRQVKAGKASFWLLSLGTIVFFVGITLVGKQPVVPIVLGGVILQMMGIWLTRHTIKDPLAWLLAVAALFTFIFGATWNPDLGFTDWDLLSLQGIFVSLWAGYWLTKSFESNKTTLNRLTVAVSGCAFALQLGWLTYNAFFV